jgi:hypothetical protein
MNSVLLLMKLAAPALADLFLKSESGKHMLPVVRIAVQGKECFAPDDLESTDSP